MKKIFFAVLLCLSSVFVKGQTMNVIPINPPCPGDSGRVEILVSISSSYTVTVSDGSSNTTSFSGIGFGLPTISHTTNNLATGTYTVTLLDTLSNSWTDTATILSPTNIVVDSVSIISYPTCVNPSGGNIIAHASGGTPPYSISYLDTSLFPGNNSNLMAGDYFITVIDANGCEFWPFSNFNLAMVNTFTIQPTITQNCAAGTNTITLTETGTPALPISYSISPGNYTSNILNNLPNGIYTVVATDANGCTKTTQFTIGSSVSIAAGNMQGNCSATTSNLQLTGATTYSVNGVSIVGATFTGNVGANYTITGIDAAGCIGTKQHLVTPSNPKLGIQSVMKPFCIPANNGAIQLTNNFTTYTLMPGNLISSSPMFSSIVAGNYTITATNSFGCVSTTSTILNTTNFNANINSNACSGLGTLSAVAAPSSGSYTYLWSNGATTPSINITTQGLYSVAITDNNTGCANSSSITIVAPSSPLTIAFSNIVHPGCGALSASGSFDVNVNGGIPGPNGIYTFTLSGGFGAITSPASIGIVTGLATGSYTVIVTDANGCTATSSIFLVTPNVPSLSVTTTPVACVPSNNATATVNAIGGIAPYTYAWSCSGSVTNTATMLSAGLCNITVTDAALCASTLSFIINAPALPAVSVYVSSADTCNLGTGAICISSYGGTPPYSYYYNGSQPTTSTCKNGLSAGFYTITAVDVNGCSANSVATVPSFAGFGLSLTHQDLFCTQGYAIISANIIGTAVSPITYTNSSNTANGSSFNTSAGGYYSMTATDASGCSTSSWINIQKTDSLIATVKKGIGCGDDTLLINSSWNNLLTGYTPLGSVQMYPFNSNFTNATMTTYTIVATPSGQFCNDTTYATILPSLPSASVISSSNINPSCLNANDGSITVLANPIASNASYSLIKNIWPSNWTFIQQSSSPLFSGLAPGSYNITVRDSFGCYNLSTSLTNSNANCGNISGHVVIDTNTNCFFDSGENTNANRMVILNPGNQITYTNQNGYFVFPGQPYGSYSIQTNAAPGYIPICSATSAAVVSNTNSNIVINRYDSIAPLVNYSIWSWGGCLSPALAVWNPNFLKRNINYSLYHTPNIGGNARIYAVFDSVQYFGSSLPAHSGISGDTVYWDLPIGSNGNIEVTFSYPPNTQAGPGQNINYYVTQHPLDSNLANNFSPTTITICTSYDPNDKQVNPEGATSNGFTALNDSVLNYKVRFQNTGNAPAGNVIIRDTLDSDLDITSFSVISASHSYQIEVEQNHILVFKFLGIMLPDSASDQEGSNGYIAYTIKKKPGTLPGDIVSNTAHIYFDYNAPIVTNTTTNTYYENIKNASTQITKNTNCSNVCGNGSVLINAQGGAGTLTYSILPNCASTQVSGNLIAPLPSGNFTVQVKDQAGNIENLPITIGSPTPINLSINTTNASGANGGSAQANVSGGTTPYTYNWSASGCSGATCNNLNVGTYTLSILDAEGCSTSSNFTISYPTSVQQINLENSIQLFPNPTKDILFVTGTNNLGSISISNQMGQIIWSANLNTNETQISTAGWANGVYYLRNGGRVYKVSVQD